MIFVEIYWPFRAPVEEDDVLLNKLRIVNPDLGAVDQSPDFSAETVVSACTHLVPAVVAGHNHLTPPEGLAIHNRFSRNGEDFMDVDFAMIVHVSDPSPRPDNNTWQARQLAYALRQVFPTANFRVGVEYSAVRWANPSDQFTVTPAAGLLEAIAAATSSLSPV